jgi:hypothetical protein
MEPATAAGPPTQKTSHPAGVTGAGAAMRRAPWSILSATVVSLVAVGLGGAALLVWWVLAFHQANAQLWMVPAGLVLLGTPVMVWLSLFASDDLCSRQATPPPPAADEYTSA